MRRIDHQPIADAAPLQARICRTAARRRTPGLRRAAPQRKGAGAARFCQNATVRLYMGGFMSGGSCRFHRVCVWSPGLPGLSARRWRALWSRPGRRCACWRGRAATGAIWKGCRSRSPKARSRTRNRCRKRSPGCRYLFHVAADYRLWVPDPAAMHRVNVEGTRELMLAAQAAGVERIVYTSSVAVLGIVKGGDRRRGDAEPRRGHDRPLQAVEIRGRGGGPRTCRDARPAGGHRQSLDADRPRRHQADPDRHS